MLPLKPLTHLSVAPAAVLALLASAPQASALTVVTFSGPVHGEVVDTDFAAQGVNAIATTNLGGGPNLGVIFDSSQIGATADPDLQGPAWSAGNLAPGTELGNLLIIQENASGCDDDVCNAPDDEGSRPAGTFTIDFSAPLLELGFDLIDVEGSGLEGGRIEFFDGANAGASVSWADLVTPGAFYDPTIVFGDRSANRVAPIGAAQIGLTSFDRVVIRLGGSGAIDNLHFTPVPEPTSLLLLSAGLLGLARGGRPRGR